MTLLAGRALLALVAAVPQGTLQDARVRIAVAGETAGLVARYRVTDAGDSVRFHAVRAAKQEVVFDRRLRGARFRLDTLPGMFRLTAAGAGRSVVLELRYTVGGDLSRIPLFVPETPAAPGQSRITIVVQGVAPGRATRFAVPRFTRDAGGVWRAAPDHLPSFVALVKPEGGISVPALAQGSVVLIALGGTIAWLLAQLAARRST